LPSDRRFQYLVHLVIDTVSFLLGDKALLGGVEVAVRIELIVDELGESRCAEGALHFLLGRPVLALVLFEAGEAGEIAALTAGQDA
jgi:hypothetical protein